MGFGFFGFILDFLTSFCIFLCKKFSFCEFGDCFLRKKHRFLDFSFLMQNTDFLGFRFKKVCFWAWYINVLSLSHHFGYEKHVFEVFWVFNGWKQTFLGFESIETSKSKFPVRSWVFWDFWLGKASFCEILGFLDCSGHEKHGFEILWVFLRP